MDVATKKAEAIAAKLLDDYLARQWSAVRNEFDERMLAALSEEALAESTDAIMAKLGKLTSTGEPSTMSSGDYVVVDIPLTFENAPMKFRVSVGADGKVAGMFLLNPAVA